MSKKPLNKLVPFAVSVAALAGLFLPPAPAAATTQGVTTFACTAACTVTGTITSTVPVSSVFPFYLFICLDGRRDSSSQEIRPTRVGPIVAGVYNYTWTATKRSRIDCIGYAELTVFGASDNYQTDTRYAPFNSEL